MTAMTQEEIVAAVKTVAQGLDALRSEHAGLLHGLHEAPDPVANERATMVQQSAEMIELGLGEAQVSFQKLYRPIKKMFVKTSCII